MSLVKNYKDRKAVSQVCKQWRQAENQSRTSIRVHNLELLPALLQRYPNLAAFQTSKALSDENIELLAEGCPKLEALDLTAPSCRTYYSEASTFAIHDLCSLVKRFPKLSNVSLRMWRFIGKHDSTTEGDPKNLDVQGRVTALKLDSCIDTDTGLRCLTEGFCSKTIKLLDLTGCYGLSDHGVSFLQKMSVLEELSLAYCNDLVREVTDEGGVALSRIRTLKKLDLSWGPEVTDTTMVALAKKCTKLEKLVLKGNRYVSRDGILAFKGHKRLQALDVNYTSHYVNKTDLEDLSLACPVMREMQESTRSPKRRKLCSYSSACVY